MSKTSQLLDDLRTHQPSPEELQERLDAAWPRTNLIATTNGTVLEAAPTPNQTPREWPKPEQTTD